MRPIKTTIPFREALELTLAAATPIDRTERVALADAGGRVLAETIAAGADVPPFARAAMDGFAVRAADTLGATGASPKTLRSVDVIFTGDAPRRPLAAGECAEIATGAPVPDGADAVVMVEETDRADGSSRRDAVAIRMAVRPGQNVTPRANDIKAGEQLLAPGDLLTPSRAGCLRSRGPTARRRLRTPRGRDGFDRQRDRRAWPAARPRADLRHQSLHAVRGGLAARRRGPGAARPRRTTCRRSRRCSWKRRARRTSSCSREAARWASAISCSTRCGRPAK